MRILHYTPTYAPAWRWGGPVVSTTLLCQELAKEHQVTVYTSNAGIESINPPRQDIRDGVQVHYFPRIPGMGIRCPEMEQAVRASVHQFDILHVTGVWQRTSPAACRAASAARVPYVISPRGALGRYSWRQKTIKKLLYFLLEERRNLAAASGFHFTSLMEEAECARFAPGCPQCIIPNGFIPAQRSRDESAGKLWRQSHRIPASSTLFLNVGRLHHKKGLELIPKALAPIAKTDWVIAFVGDDSDGTQSKLRSAFGKLGLTDRVHFIPAQSPEMLPAIYSAADIFLLPSLHENFGNVVAEALSSGCPAIISDQVGFGSGLMPFGAIKVLPREPNVWTQSINDYLTQTWRPPSSAHISNWAGRNFGNREIGLQMIEFYHRVMHFSHAKSPSPS